MSKPDKEYLQAMNYHHEAEEVERLSLELIDRVGLSEKAGEALARVLGTLRSASNVRNKVEDRIALQQVQREVKDAIDIFQEEEFECLFLKELAKRAGIASRHVTTPEAYPIVKTKKSEN